MNPIMKPTTEQQATARPSGVHDEFVLVLQGASSLYRFGSDRVANAEHYLDRHAAAMLDFDHPELHPDTRAMYRRMAAERVRPSDCTPKQLAILNTHRGGELLAALQKIYALYEKHTEKSCSTCFRDMAEIARAAIAKANES